MEFRFLCELLALRPSYRKEFDYNVLLSIIIDDERCEKKKKNISQADSQSHVGRNDVKIEQR